MYIFRYGCSLVCLLSSLGIDHRFNAYIYINTLVLLSAVLRTGKFALKKMPIAVLGVVSIAVDKADTSL